MANIFQRIFTSDKKQAPQNQPAQRMFDSKPSFDAKSFSYTPTSIDATIGYDLAQPYIDKYGSGKYVRFGVDNLYPQHLIDMYYGSAFHSSIMKFLADIIMSSDVNVSLPGTTLEDDLMLTKIKRKISPDFIRRVTLEYLIHNRNDFFVYKEGKKVKNVDIVGAEMIRKATRDKGFFYREDWEKWETNEEYIKEFDLYRECEGRGRELFEIQELGPGNLVYALPQYVSAANWIWLDYQVSYFQKQNINNSINPSAIIKLYKKFANKDDQEKYIRSLQNSFAGARNSGKVIVLSSSDKDTSPDIEMMQSNQLDAAFKEVQESIVNNIAYAHQISPVVMGVATAGKLGATTEIIDSYHILRNTKLKALAMNIENILDRVAKLYDKNAEVNLELSNDFVESLQNNADAGNNSAIQQMINELKKGK